MFYLLTMYNFVFYLSHLLTPVHYTCLFFLHVLPVDYIYLCFRHIIPVDSSSSRFSSTTSILQSPIVDSLSLHLQTRNEKKYLIDFRVKGLLLKIKMWCHICCFALMIDAVWYTRRMCMKKLRWKNVNVKNWSKEKTVCCLLAILIQNFQKPNQTLEVKRRRRLRSNVLAASCLPLWESLFETGLSQTARFSSKGNKTTEKVDLIGHVPDSLFCNRSLQ